MEEKSVLTSHCGISKRMLAVYIEVAHSLLLVQVSYIRATIVALNIFVQL